MAKQDPVEPAAPALIECVRCGEHGVAYKEPTEFPFRRPQGWSSGVADFHCLKCGAILTYEFFDQSMDVRQ